MLFFRRRKRKRREVSLRPQSKMPSPPYAGQEVAIPFLVLAPFLFALQVLLATAGSLHLLWPDLPTPIPFNAGRAIHLNLSLFWPILGLMGATYYVLPLQTKANLGSPKLARLHFWLALFTVFGILTSLALGYSEGREYLEAIRPFDLAVIANLILFAVNVVLSLRKRKTGPRADQNSPPQTSSGKGDGLRKSSPPWRPTLFGLELGLALAVVTYAVNAFFSPNPVVDEFLKFWVVHLWEEGIFELLAILVIGQFLVALTGLDPRQLEKWYNAEILLVLFTGFYATGHHYFWVGLPSYWLYLGGIFGALQPLPIFLLTRETLSAAAKTREGRRREPALGFLAASALWNLIGAGGLGFLITTPFINRYTHGTYLTSAHAHAALFGTYGFLALAAVYFVLNPLEDASWASQPDPFEPGPGPDDQQSFFGWLFTNLSLARRRVGLSHRAQPHQTVPGLALPGGSPLCRRRPIAGLGYPAGLVRPDFRPPDLCSSDATAIAKTNPQFPRLDHHGVFQSRRARLPGSPGSSLGPPARVDRGRAGFGACPRASNGSSLTGLARIFSGTPGIKIADTGRFFLLNGEINRAVPVALEIWKGGWFVAQKSENSFQPGLFSCGPGGSSFFHLCHFLLRRSFEALRATGWSGNDDLRPLERRQ